MLGRRIGRGVTARHMRRDRAVVDDATTLRLLALHHAEGMLGAEKRARQVGRDDIRPLLEGQILERDAASAGASIVEQEIDAAVGLFDLIKQRSDRARIGDVSRYIGDLCQRRLEALGG